MSNVDGDTKFNITDTKLLVPIFPLSTKDNVKLTKQLKDGFKRSIYWNKYNLHVLTQTTDNNNPITIKCDSTFKELKDYFLFLLMLMVMLIKLKEIVKKVFSSTSGDKQLQYFDWW